MSDYNHENMKECSAPVLSDGFAAADLREEDWGLLGFDNASNEHLCEEDRGVLKTPVASPMKLERKVV